MKGDEVMPGVRDIGEIEQRVVEPPYPGANHPLGAL